MADSMKDALKKVRDGNSATVPMRRLKRLRDEGLITNVTDPQLTQRGREALKD